VVSDTQVVNNIMRHQYRPLSEGEKAQMQAIKDKGLEFWELINSLGANQSKEGGARELALAKTHVEDAVMRATRYITA
jgi:hypothetical protein